VCFKVTTPARQRHGAMKRVYELVWAIRVPDYENGLSRRDAAWEGYYYKFLGARPVDSIDGHCLVLQ